MRRSWLCAVGWAALALSAACGESGGKSGGTPAAPRTSPLPSPYTLSMDLSVADGEVPDPGLGLTTGLHYAQASVYLAAAHAAAAHPLRTPVAMLAAAQAAEPVLKAAGVYVWSFSLEAAGRVSTGNLSGVFADDDRSHPARWALRVTSTPTDPNGCCQGFLLLEGETEAPGKGRWRIYDPARPERKALLLSVAFEVQDAARKSLAVTVEGSGTRDGRFGPGSTATYRVQGDLATLVYADAMETGSRTIAWSRSTKAGSYTDLAGRRYCWASAELGLADVPCGP